MRSIAPLLLILAAMWPGSARPDDTGPRSRPMAAVLREPLPPENLTYSERDGLAVIAGPTFEYVVDGKTGSIVDVRATRDGETVVQLVEPARLVVGRFNSSAAGNTGETTATFKSPERIVLTTKGTMRADSEPRDALPYALTSTFYNDGVVVREVALLPQSDVAVADIHHEVKATGPFHHHLHKNRDENGFDSVWAPLPQTGEAATFSTLTSCLQVFGRKAGLAIFTDRGATRAAPGVDTAGVKVETREGDNATVRLIQRIVRENPDDGSFLTLKANEPFTFRVGLSVVPNRVAHRRTPDLRMFAWVGDDKNPYPTDREILDVARLGFGMFQMHRLGNPGDPRPPAEELDRVIKSVHDAGMLFIWTANADLMYGNAPGVLKMKEEGKWPLWQGFNYGGRYKDSMDSYCDLPATCLASPNGLADYRVATINAMLDKYDVDGMYIDDNLAYANCELQAEHGHPEKVYDCLIELHEMNWRRRQTLRARVPHAVLIDHCAKATIQPVICDFDSHLYGEGYTFPTIEGYWAQYGALKNMDAQGGIWPGGKDLGRSSTKASYNIDLLTGGGQYIYIDWRLYPEKFTYAAGVTAEEVPLVRAYNLAQYGFGLPESRPYYFAESAGLFSIDAPGAYATIYHNEVWGDHLVVMANMSGEDKQAALTFQAPDRLGLSASGTYAVLDVNAGECRRVPGEELTARGLAGVNIPAGSLKLFYLRRLADDAPRHLWGGKRLSERWDASSGTLTVELQGPPGAELNVVIATGAKPIGEVRVNGAPVPFESDANQGVARGKIKFGAEAARVEVTRTR